MRPEVVQALADMINADALPTIREFVGHRHRRAVGAGHHRAGAAGPVDAARRGRAELVFGPHDALPFISSNAAALSDAALAARCFETGARAALAVAALSFAAVRGNAEAYAPAVELATPMPGARATCRVMRGLVGCPGAGPDPGPVRAARAAAGARHPARRAQRAARHHRRVRQRAVGEPDRSWPTVRSPTTVASTPATWR